MFTEERTFSVIPTWFPNISVQTAGMKVTKTILNNNIKPAAHLRITTSCSVELARYGMWGM